MGGEWWWQTEAAPTEALRKSYEFDRFLILTRVYRRAHCALCSGCASAALIPGALPQG